MRNKDRIDELLVEKRACRQALRERAIREKVAEYGGRLRQVKECLSEYEIADMCLRYEKLIMLLPDEQLLGDERQRLYRETIERLVAEIEGGLNGTVNDE